LNGIQPRKSDDYKIVLDFTKTASIGFSRKTSSEIWPGPVNSPCERWDFIAGDGRYVLGKDLRSGNLVQPKVARLLRRNIESTVPQAIEFTS
jgi:hypothetical protein